MAEMAAAQVGTDTRNEDNDDFQTTRKPYQHYFPDAPRAAHLNSQYMMERRWGFEPNTTPPKAKAL